MKIKIGEKEYSIELPEEMGRRLITVFCGGEMVASKQPSNDYFEVVVVKCQRCGKCCEDFSSEEEWIFYDPEKGHCKYLAYDSEGLAKCELGIYRPFGCSTNAGKEPDYCQHKKIRQE